MKKILFSLLCLQIELLASSPEFLSIDEKIQFLASQDLLTLHSLLLGELRDRGMEIESEVLSKAHLNVVGFADHMEVTELSSGKRHFIDAFLIESGVLPNGTTLDSYTKSVDFSGQTTEEIKNQLVDLERVIMSAIESRRPGEML